MIAKEDLAIDGGGGGANCVVLSAISSSMSCKNLRSHNYDIFIAAGYTRSEIGWLFLKMGYFIGYIIITLLPH